MRRLRRPHLPRSVSARATHAGPGSEMNVLGEPIKTFCLSPRWVPVGASTEAERMPSRMPRTRLACREWSTSFVRGSTLAQFERNRPPRTSEEIPS